MGSFADTLRAAAAFAAEAAAETLWPTRCAICDVPGDVLCAQCEAELPYLDYWRSCARCGSAYGRVQCDACNPVSLARIGRESLPYAGCVAATMFSASTGRVVRVFKDQGEQRLSATMARCIARAMPPAWTVDAVTFVPATLAAARYRGYDHAHLLARELAGLLGTACLPLLARPRTRDQRRLTGRQRIANLQGSFRALPGADMPPSVLLVDDVYTTGATLCAATDALIAAGAAEVRCATFARV